MSICPPETPDRITMPIESQCASDKANISARRWLFSALVLSTMIGLWCLMFVAVRANAPSALGVIVLGLYTLTIPWLSIGFWNALIGFVLMHLCKAPLGKLLPKTIAKAASDDTLALTVSTAILICIRNENPTQVIRNLSQTVKGLLETGYAEAFHLYILSDTNKDDVAAIESHAFDAFKAGLDPRIGLTYRRREHNHGYKAGNVQDFCQRWGHQHEFALTLDADSIMSGAAIVRLVRMMQAEPKLGILQGLVIALPSQSAFTRLFQFGMRLGMRSWTMGSAWWQADCGPYWGHNALFRIKPFKDHCQLPQLKPNRHGTRHILSHDQVEAVLMRRAGYEVRVYPLEDESWEQNPPTLPEFVQRDLRWCEGNMQYGGLLSLAGLALVSRIQLLLAMMMFTSAPAWIGLMLCATAVALSVDSSLMHFDPHWMQIVFTLTLLMSYLPKLASGLAVLLSKTQRCAFGGGLRFVLSFLSETLFSLLVCPVMWFNQTAFLLRLALGRSKGWASQTRDDHTVPWLTAARLYWPHTVFGLVSLTLIGLNLPSVRWYAMFYILGLITSIPVAVLLSWPSVGGWMTRVGLGQLPEETHPPRDLLALELPALLK